MSSSIKQKRVDKLWSEAVRLLEEGAYEDALKIADQLERERYSGSFDIAAQAYAGLGQLPEAIAVLERGVTVAPTAWPNWELLGNYRSDSGLFEEAALAYATALECEGVWVDSIRVNQAILATRRKDYQEALRIADLLSDPEFELSKVALKAGIHLRTGDPKAALEACRSAQHPEEPSSEERRDIAQLAATEAKARLELGEPTNVVRERLLEAMDAYPESVDLLDCFRELANERSDTARVFEVLLTFEFDPSAQRRYDAVGFVRGGRAIADSPAEAVSYFCQLEREAPLLVADPPQVEPIEMDADPLKGVISRSGRAYYASRD